jgi:energy-coupling factor transporter ATP-binding protein EcfA2
VTAAPIRIIGIVGRAGSGKSTLAKGLIATLPSASPVSLATPFKLEGVALGHLPVDQVFGPAPKGQTTREWLQNRGTERGRYEHGEDVWLRHADADIYRLSRYGIRNVVVDDVRFVNEAEWLRARGGVLVKLVGRATPLSADAASHASETAIDGIEGDLTLNTALLSPDSCVAITYGFLLGHNPVQRIELVEPLEPANPHNAMLEGATE